MRSNRHALYKDASDAAYVIRHASDPTGMTSQERAPGQEADRLAEELSRLGREIGRPVDLRRNDSKAVRITVVGEFSTGKSTLVNSILGEDLLPTRVTPTTSVITEIVRGPEFTVEARYTDGTAEVLVSPAAVPAGDFYMDRLASLAAGSATRSPAELLKGLMDDEEWVARVERVRITHPAVPAGLVIVDTPGTNDISQSRLEVLYKHLPESDIVWMVMSARSVLKASEVSFLKDKLLGADLARVRFIVNQIDALDEAEVEDVKAYVADTLPSIIREVADGYGKLGSTVVRDFLLEAANAPPVVYVSALELRRDTARGRVWRRVLDDLLGEALRELERLSYRRELSFLSRMNAVAAELSEAVSRRQAIMSEEASEIEGRLTAEARVLDQTLLEVRNLRNKLMKEIDQIRNRTFAELSTIFDEGKRRLISGQITSEQDMQKLETEIRRRLETLAERALEEVRSASQMVVPTVGGPLQTWRDLRLPDDMGQTAPGIDWDGYLGRPSTYVLAMASGMIFGPLGFIAVCGFPLLMSLFHNRRDDAERRKIISNEFAKAAGAAKAELGRIIDEQALAAETVMLGKLDECQDRISELIDSRAGKIKRDDVERWQSALSLLTASITQRLTGAQELLRCHNRGHMEGVIT